MIVPVPLEKCASVQEFFEKNGQIEIPRPAYCPRKKAECGSTEPLRRNGSYPRQVIYWGVLFVLSILRFRCRRCGKTVSRPFGWLVPYRRFSSEVVGAGIEDYATEDIGYRDVSGVLSEPEFVEPVRDIRQTELYGKMLEDGAVKPAQTDCGGCRPSHTTVFSWVAFVCKRTDSIIQQQQKELVRRQRDLTALPPESLIENPNGYKTQAGRKAQELDRLSFATVATELLLDPWERRWERLRAYFLSQAESCKDLLTDVPTWLSITHTSELAIF